MRENAHGLSSMHVFWGKYAFQRTLRNQVHMMKNLPGHINSKNMDLVKHYEVAFTECL